MATATKTKAAAVSVAEVGPVTFEEIARKKLRERIEAYRGFVQRHAAGELLDETEMTQAAELLDHLGLPQYAFERDAKALINHARSLAKWEAYVANEPQMRERGKALTVEIKALAEKLNAAKAEVHRIELGSGMKAAAYGQTVNELRVNHPHVLADLDTAVQLRIEELDRRKQTGGAA